MCPMWKYIRLRYWNQHIKNHCFAAAGPPYWLWGVFDKSASFAFNGADINIVFRKQLLIKR